MSFSYHKWILYTHLRLLNFGKGILEVSVTVSPDDYITGKTVTLSPQSDHVITVLGLLPPGTSLATLNDGNLQFGLKNIGAVQSAFQFKQSDLL